MDDNALSDAVRAALNLQPAPVAAPVAVPQPALSQAAMPAAPAAPSAPATQALAPKVADYDQGFAGWGAEDVLLLHPFKLNGVFYEAISVQVPNGEQLSRHIANRKPLSALIEMLTPIDDALLCAMHGSDYARIVDVVGEFLAGVR